MLSVLLAVIAGTIAEALGLSQVAAIADDLRARSAAWVASVLPDVYEDGIAEAQQALGATESAQDAAQRPEHQAMVQVAQRTLQRDLEATSEQMRRDAETGLDEITKRNLEKLMVEGRNAIPQASEMAREMEERGVAFTDRGGRRWKPRDYSRLVLRTQSVDVSNTANLTTAAELGSLGVRVSDGGPGDVDQPCKDADGQVWSLAYALAHKLEHPQCRRAFAPLPSTWVGEFDRE